MEGGVHENCGEHKWLGHRLRERFLGQHLARWVEKSYTARVVNGVWGIQERRWIMPRPWLLAELTYAELRAARPEVAVIPFGATEPHNYHLPYATDTIEAETIAWDSCARAYQRGANVVCLPVIPYGTETNQRELPLSMNLQPSTLLAILRDLVGSLESSGVRKCLILNSHGGNEFKGHLRELFGQTSVRIFLCNWYTMCQDEYGKIFTHRDDHAGEAETSIILHARPELVHLERADAGAARPSRFEAVRKGWVTLTRPWHLLTDSSGVGDPRLATAEKGARWLEIICAHLSDFLVELAQSPLDDQFPFARE